MKKLSLYQVAVGNYTYPLYPFTYFLDSMVAMDVQNIEIWAAGPHLYLDDFTIPMLKNISKEIKVRELNPVCLTPEQCAYPINIGAEERFIRERSYKYFIKAIQAASVMGIKKVIVTPGNGYRNKGSSDTWKYTVDGLRKIARIANKEGIQLLLEHLTKETTNIATNAKQLHALNIEINASNMKCMIDTDMMSRYDENVEDYFRETSGDIGHVHFIDGMPGGHLALGDGVLPLKSYLTSLDQNNYKGYIALEIINDRYYLDPNDAVEKSLKWLKQYLR